MSTLDTQNVESSTSPRSIGVRYGTIAGLILIAIGLIFHVAGLSDYTNQNSTMNWVANVLNWAVMGGAMFMAMKQYRDESSGFITFGRAFGIGFWVALMIAIISGIWAYVFFSFIAPDVIDIMVETQRDAMIDRGMDDAQIDQAMGITESMMNPGMMTVFATIAILITGIIIDLIVSAIVQRKPPVDMAV